MAVNVEVPMDSEVPSRGAFRLMLWWILLGAVIECVLWPRHGGYGIRYGTSLFTNGDFYYALLSPMVVWWFFRVLIPAKEEELTRLGIKGVRLGNFIFGIYVASALRAVLAAFFAIYIGVWG